MADRKDEHDDQKTIEEFHEAVNMIAGALEKWLKTDESRAVGQKQGGADESIGHESGRLIVKVLGKKRADYDADDLAQIRRTVSYVHRHLAQRPFGEITETPWRYSLMNWGHDPQQK